jgi:hypothetical protein
MEEIVRGGASLVWAASVTLVAALAAGTVALVFKGNSSDWYSFGLPIAFALIGTIPALAVLSRDRDRVAYLKVRIPLVGVPGVGKTVFLNVLFNELQRTSGFALDPETASRVLGTMNALSDGRWVTKTPDDFLYIYSARISSSWAGRSRRRGPAEYRLEMADVAGEQIGEFVPGQRHYRERSAYYRYALDSDALFFFIDYPALELRAGEPAEQLTRQTNELIFVIQAVADYAKVGPSERLDRPLAIIITKCDLAAGIPIADGRDPLIAISFPPGESYTEDRMESLLRHFDSSAAREEMRRLISIARARFNRVGVFGVSSVGRLDADGSLPERIAPVNVENPLNWVLSARPRRLGELVSGYDAGRLPG